MGSGEVGALMGFTVLRTCLLVPQRARVNGIHPFLRGTRLVWVDHVKVIVQNKTNPYWFDLFVNKIYEASPSDVTIVDDHRNMNDMDTTDLANEAEDTLTILSKYVENLETNVDKKDLDKLMHSLYNESLSMELDEC